jgi:hypothetical protein
MKEQKVKPIVLFALCIASYLVAGCTNQQVMSKTAETKISISENSVEVVSVPEDFQNFIVKGEKFCGMPSPSASLSDTGASASIAETGTGKAKFTGGSVTSDNQNLGSSTYVADEVLYRLCEIGISYNLTKEEMLDFYMQTLMLLVDETASKDVLSPEDSASTATESSASTSSSAAGKTSQ